jgi:hypothetical protein
MGGKQMNAYSRIASRNVYFLHVTIVFSRTVKNKAQYSYMKSHYLCSLTTLCEILTGFKHTVYNLTNK